MRSPTTWNPVVISEWFDHVMNTLDQATVAGLPRCSTTTDLPILIVGLPRSGSTLVEQVLDMHPQAHGAGEITALECRLERDLSHWMEPPATSG